MPSRGLVDWWNGQLDAIEAAIRRSPKPRAVATFTWSQLVWQELCMWELLDPSDIEAGELDWMVRRRGFDEEQRAFLIQGLKHIGKWRADLSARVEPEA